MLCLFYIYILPSLSLLGREEENKMEKTNNKEINQIPRVQDRPPESICMYTRRAAGIPKWRYNPFLFLCLDYYCTDYLSPFQRPFPSNTQHREREREGESNIPEIVALTLRHVCEKKYLSYVRLSYTQLFSNILSQFLLLLRLISFSRKKDRQKVPMPKGEKQVQMRRLEITSSAAAKHLKNKRRWNKTTFCRRCCCCCYSFVLWYAGSSNSKTQKEKKWAPKSLVLKRDEGK